MSGAVSRVFRGLSLSLAVAGITAAVVFIFAYLFYPVTGIQVEGARMYPESEVSQTVSDGASLLTLNAKMVERQVESNSWVKGAKVTKQWRSGIVLVEVEERRAVLDGVLNDRRIILAADGTELPGLGGASLGRVAVDEDHVEEILRAGRNLKSHGITLQSVDDVGAGGIEATVEDGRKIIFANRLADSQIEALAGIMRRHPDAPLFDLRSPGRVVVSENPPSSRGSGASG